MSNSAGRRTKNGKAGESTPVDYGPLDLRIGYVLRRAQLAVFRDFFRTMGELHVTPAQYSILTVLEHNPGLTPTHVADALGIKKANLVAMIRELERRGLVRREAAKGDRRSVSIYLSGEGARLAPRLHKACAAHERRIRGTIGDSHYALLFEPLGRLAGLENGDA